MPDDTPEHDIFKEEELISVKMRVKDYRRMMAMIERDESLSVVGRHIKTIMLGVAGVITAYFVILKFFKDQLIG